MSRRRQARRSGHEFRVAGHDHVPRPGSETRHQPVAFDLNSRVGVRLHCPRRCLGVGGFQVRVMEFGRLDQSLNGAETAKLDTDFLLLIFNPLLKP